MVTPFESEISGLAFDQQAQLWWAVGAPKGDDDKSDDASLFAISLKPGFGATIERSLRFYGAVDPEAVAVLGPGAFAVADESEQTILIVEAVAGGLRLANGATQSAVVQVCYDRRNSALQ